MKSARGLAIVLVGCIVSIFIPGPASLAQPQPDAELPLSSSLSGIDGSRGFLVSISNGLKDNRLAEIHVPRKLAKQLGMSPPVGFSVMPMAVEAHNHDNPDELALVSLFNRDYFRWVGSLPLKLGAATELLILAARPKYSNSELTLRYTASFGADKVVYTTVELTPPTARKPVPESAH
ncbi:MAG TPA: hypothetical protein VLI06_17495 [Solimonas sp.]|nr:hypothetical protein [Solimonas sp.]